MLLRCQCRLAHGVSGLPGRFTKSVVWLSRPHDFEENVLHIEKREGRATLKHTFKLKRGVFQSIHGDRVREGGLTVVLSCPLVEIFIRGADPTHLESFMRLLSQIKDGIPVRPSLLRDLKKTSSHDWADRRSLRIPSRREYPVGRSFPPHLQKLHAPDLGLRAIDRRVLRLEALTVLDLANNRIGPLDADTADGLARMGLHRLDLSGNPLVTWPVLTAGCRLHATLEQLLLARADLAWVPASLWELERLTQLNLAGNRLRWLPEGIPGGWHLTSLVVRENPLACLPASAAHLRLTHLDMSRMERSEAQPALPRYVRGAGVLSLEAWAMKAVLASGRGRFASALPFPVRRELRLILQCPGGFCRGRLARYIASNEAHVVRAREVSCSPDSGPMHSAGAVISEAAQPAAVLECWCVPCFKRVHEREVMR